MHALALLLLPRRHSLPLVRAALRLRAQDGMLHPRASLLPPPPSRAPSLPHDLHATLRSPVTPLPLPLEGEDDDSGSDEVGRSFSRSKALLLLWI